MRTYREWRGLNKIWWGAGTIVFFLFLIGIGMNAYRTEMYDRMLFGILEENGISEEQMQNIVAQLTEAGERWTKGEKEKAEERGEIYLQQSGYAKTRDVIRQADLGKKLCWGVGLWIVVVLSGYFLIQSWKKKMEKQLEMLTERMERNERNVSEEDVYEEDSLFSEMESQIRMIENRGNWQVACAKKEKEGMGELLENMAHQLKTPVSVAQLYLEVLLRKETDAVKRQKLEVCVARMEELTELITALLKEGKMQAGKIQMEKKEQYLDIAIEHAWNRVRILAEERDIQCQFFGEKEICFAYNLRWMTEAFENLLKNCILHGKACSVLEVWVQKRKGVLQIQIRQKGNHVTEEEKRHLFERFYCAKDSEHRGGSGIGLHLAKMIIAQHHGTISLENTEEGVCFQICFPVFDRQYFDHSLSSDCKVCDL